MRVQLPLAIQLLGIVLIFLLDEVTSLLMNSRPSSPGDDRSNCVRRHDRTGHDLKNICPALIERKRVPQTIRAMLSPGGRAAGAASPPRQPRAGNLPQTSNGT
jgi:hypothetical protein